MHWTYRAIGLLLGHYWKYLCRVVGRLGSGMTSWIIQGSPVRVSIRIGLSNLQTIDTEQGLGLQLGLG